MIRSLIRIHPGCLSAEVFLADPQHTKDYTRNTAVSELFYVMTIAGYTGFLTDVKLAKMDVIKCHCMENAKNLRQDVVWIKLNLLQHNLMNKGQNNIGNVTNTCSLSLSLSPSLALSLSLSKSDINTKKHTPTHKTHETKLSQYISHESDVRYRHSMLQENKQDRCKLYIIYNICVI